LYELPLGAVESSSQLAHHPVAKVDLGDESSSCVVIMAPVRGVAADVHIEALEGAGELHMVACLTKRWRSYKTGHITTILGSRSVYHPDVIVKRTYLDV
jgi:hypothetical protein